MTLAPGTGTVSFGTSGSVAMSGGGRTDIYYNPASFAAPTSFSSKVSGTYTAWMLVNNVTALQNISTNLSGSYALGTNIDASATASWNSNAGFIPLGTFTGKFDGLGQTITGLTINRSGSNSVSLFNTNQGTISNLTIASAAITGGGNTSILTGVNSGTIKNVNVSGTVRGTNTNGGLAGHNTTSGVITNSTASVALTSTSYVNGVAVGSNEGTIRNVTTSGSLSATADSAGGLVGKNSSGAILDSSSSSVNLTSTSYSVGGAVGNNGGSITSTFATGTVNVNSSNTAGGLVGTNTSNGSIADSYATGAVSGNSGLGGLVGSNAGTIVRSWTSSSVTGGNIGGFVSNNTGTISNSYATGAVNGTGSANIGGFASQNFGTLTADYSTGAVKGTYWLGGLVGTNSGTIKLSYSTSSVTGTAGALGGLVGVNSSSGNISGSYSTGTIKGTDTLGGLVGDNVGVISNSYTTGAVQSTNDTVGGLVGKNEASGNVSYSYANNTVTANSNYAGAFGTNSGTVTSVYWNKTTSGLSAGTSSGSSVGITGLTAAQFTSAANFVGFDFSGYWRIYEGHTVPLLRSFLTAITVTADSLSKVYDGTGYTGALTNATYSLAGATTSGHLLGVSTAYNIGKNAGVYAADLYTDGQQGYDITIVGGTYTIQKATLSLTGGNAASKTYDGTTTTSVTGSLSGIVSGDTVSILNGQFADKNAATGKAVTVALTGTDAANYSLTQPGLVANIYKAVLNVGATGTNKVYDGSSTAAVTYSDNRISGDSLSVSGAATFANKNVGSSKAVSVASIVVTGTDAGNYTWNTTAATTATITQAALTLTGGSAASKTYDGTTTTSVTGTLSGLVSGDAVNIAYGQFADKNAANGKTVSVMLTGSDLSNYSFSQPALIANIYKAVLTVGATASNKVYDGTTSDTATLSDNRISGDNLTITGIAAFADKNAGTGKAVTVSGIGVTGADAGNYTWNTTANSVANITQAALSLTGGSAASKTYDGTTTTSVTGTLSGLVSGDAVSIVNGQFADKNAASGKAVSVTLTGSDLSNYSFSQPSLIANIYKAVLTVGATASDKVYDGSASAAVALSDNRISGDSLTITGAGTFANKNVGTSKAVTVSGIGVTGADAGNYTWNSSAASTASITQAVLALTGGNAASKTYDGTTTTSVTGTLSGLVAGDAVSIVNGQFADKNAATGKAVTVMLTGSDLSNYSFAQPMLVADIYKAVLTIGATASNKVYDGTTNATAALSDNRVSGDNLSISGLAAFADKNVGTGKAVTVSGIGVTGADAGNYTWNTTANSAANITQAALSLTGGSAASKTYDGSTTTSVTGTLSGLVAGDAVSIVNGQFADKNAATSKTVSVTLTGSDLSNYSFAQPSLVADIYKAVLNIGATALDKTYDGSTSATVAFSNNKLVGDSLSITGVAAFSDKNVGTGKAVAVSNIMVTGADAGNYTWNTTAHAVASILQSATDTAVNPAPATTTTTTASAISPAVTSTVTKVADTLLTSINVEPVAPLAMSDTQPKTTVAKERRNDSQSDVKVQNVLCEAGEEGLGRSGPRTGLTISTACPQ